MGYCSYNLIRRNLWKAIFIFGLKGGGQNSLVCEYPFVWFCYFDLAIRIFFIKVNGYIYWNNKVMSAWRWCLPVLNVWTHFIHLRDIHLIINRAADKVAYTSTSTLKSKVTTSIACVSVIIPNRSSTFKHHWANSQLRCCAC